MEYEVTRLSYHDTTIYSFGYVTIQTSDKGAHEHAYASSEETSGATSHFVLPVDVANNGELADDDKITVEYSPIEYKVTYEVFVDGVSSATRVESGEEKNANNELYSLHSIFGNSRPKTTTNQHVSTTVTIPAGYYGRVYIGNANESGNFPTSLKISQDEKTGRDIISPDGGTSNVSQYETFPNQYAESAEGKERYGNYALGEELVYMPFAAEGNNPNEVVIDGTKGPAFFSLSGTYQSGYVGSASKDLTVRVVLVPRTSFKFSDALWLETFTGGVVQANKMQDNSHKVTDSSGATISDTDGDYVIPKDGFTWSFTTKSAKVTGTDYSYPMSAT